MNNLIVYSKPRSPVSEAYRSVRTNIQFANIDRDIKTIIFTSASKGEGKTTTLANLAITMAEAGHKVLVIDCDFRNPSIHKSFEISNKRGVTNILLEGKDYNEYVNHIAQLDNLDIITAGKVPRNPSEMLYSNTMKNFIGKIKQDYDYVLIDSPPVLPVTDAAVMANYIDGVIMVCAAGSAEVDSMKMAVDSLRKVGANIIGGILNRVKVKHKDYHSYYYYSQKD